MADAHEGNEQSLNDDERAIRAIVARASHDREFRAALLANPRWAIDRAYGVAIPPAFRIRFIEKGADLDALVVLPDFTAVETDAAELLADDAQASELLSHVSGGGADAARSWWRDIVN